jgi:hypothetical protein
MVQECLRQVAIEWLQLIGTLLGADGAANYLGSVASLLAIAVALRRLDFAGQPGSAMIRIIILLAFAVWLAYAANAEQVLLEHAISEVKQCLRELLPPFTLIPISGLLGTQ